MTGNFDRDRLVTFKGIRTRSDTGAVPSEIKVRLHNKQKKVGGKNNVVISEVSEIGLPINSEDGNDPQWLEHPEHKFSADVVCIRIADDLKFREKYAFNVANKWKEYHQEYEPGAMDEVFVNPATILPPTLSRRATPTRCVPAVPERPSLR